MKKNIQYSRNKLFYSESNYYSAYVVIDVVSHIMKMYLGFSMVKIMINGLIHLPMVADDYEAYLDVFKMFLPFVVLLVFIRMAYIKFVEHNQLYVSCFLSMIASAPLYIFLFILLFNGLNIPVVSNQYLNELVISGLLVLLCLGIKEVIRIVYWKKNKRSLMQGKGRDLMQEESDKKSKME